MPDDNSCTIRFVRPSGYADRIRSYQMLVNGRDVGTIGNGKTLEVKAAPGAIRIEAKIDWAKARPLTVNTVPRQTVEVEVRNRWGVWLALWAITFGKDDYLLLTLLAATT